MLTKKRKRGDRIFRFKTFCSPGCPLHFTGTFQENIRSLLELGTRESDRRWSFQLELHRHPRPVHATLYVVEERVDERSSSRHCHHCRYIGWGHHMICNRRFHFVLPSRKALVLREGVHHEVVRGYGGDKGKGAMVAMNLKGQLMHGVVHSNGFGHLLCVNGIEGGSEIVSGRQIMDLWDRICSGMQLRKVSLTDTARRDTMSLRLLHGVAYGEPWFGLWGYRFGRGSFGVTHTMYRHSLEALQSLPICLVAPHYGALGLEVPSVVARYQALSGNSLLTLGHLLHFMLELRRRLPRNSTTTALAAMDYHVIAAEPACRWSTKRVEMAAQVIVEALRKAGQRWVSRQDVRDSARAYVGDTGLLDFVLKSIGNHVVGSYMVRRMVNPVTKVLEYSLEDVGQSMVPPAALQDGATVTPMAMRAARSHITRGQLTRDLLYLYKYVLKEQSPAVATGIFGAIPMAVRIVLDTKQLVKDYGGESSVAASKGNNVRVLCSVHLRADGGGVALQRPPCCEEPIALSPHATIGDLKREAEAHFRNTYTGLEGFVAEALVGVGGCGDSDLVQGLVESGSGVVISGRVQGAVSAEEIYEGWCGEGDSSAVVVNCQCGAKEEDGERMICCDVCEVWQHTRCLQIPNSEEVPAVFLCRHCEQDIAALPSLLP